jgi:hypothetical protein
MGINQILTPLCFVDNVLLFGNGTAADGHKIHENLAMYMKATGMEINVHKSSLVMNKIPDG